MDVELPAWLFGSIVRLTHLCASVGRSKTIRVSRGPYAILLGRLFVFDVLECPYGARRVISDLLPGLQYRHQYDEELPTAIRRYCGEIIAWSKGWLEYSFASGEQIHAAERDEPLYLYPYQEDLDGGAAGIETIEVGYEIVGQLVYMAFRQLIEKEDSAKLLIVPRPSLRRLKIYFDLPSYRRCVVTDTLEESLYGTILTQSIKDLILEPYSKKKKKRTSKKTLMKLKRGVPVEFTRECVTILEAVFNLKALVDIDVDSVPRTYELLSLDAAAAQPSVVEIFL